MLNKMVSKLLGLVKGSFVMTILKQAIFCEVKESDDNSEKKRRVYDN